MTPYNGISRGGWLPEGVVKAGYGVRPVDRVVVQGQVPADTNYDPSEAELIGEPDVSDAD